MNILQVIPYFAWEYGGPVKVVHDLSMKLVERGHNVSIYTTDVGLNGPLNEKQLINNDLLDIKYFRCFNNYLANNFKLHLSSEMRKTIKNNLKNFDIIHLHESRGIPNLYVRHYAKKYKIPYILQAHGSSPTKIGKQEFKKTITKIPFDIIFGKKIFNEASKIIAVSEFEKKLFIETGVSPEKIELVPNGIDTLQYSSLPQKNQFKHKYLIKDTEKIILYLGRLHQRKGIDILIKSFNEINKSYDDVKLVIVGPDDGFEEDLKKLVKNLAIDKVLFTGPLFNKEKLEVFVDADLLVYTAKQEIFGLVPFEALMCDTPVIVSNDSGCGELVNKVKCGCIIDYGNTEELKIKILEVLDNKKLANKMVDNGKNYIHSNLKWDTIVDKIEYIYYLNK